MTEWLDHKSDNIFLYPLSCLGYQFKIQHLHAAIHAFLNFLLALNVGKRGYEVLNSNHNCFQALGDYQ